MSASNCTYDLITNSTNSCLFVSTNCPSYFIDFYKLHYCTFNSQIYYTIPVLAIFFIILFYLLSDTNNRYLSVALLNICNKLKLSQNFAGITLLSLGNGAPDLVESIVASSHLNMEGIELALGNLLGSAMIATTMVLSFVMIYSGQVQAGKFCFSRDITAYIVTLITLALFGWYGYFTIVSGLFLIGIYVVFLIIACLHEKYARQNSRESEAMAKELFEEIAKTTRKRARFESSKSYRQRFWFNPESSTSSGDELKIYFSKKYSSTKSQTKERTHVMTLIEEDFFYNGNEVDHVNHSAISSAKNGAVQLATSEYPSFLYLMKGHYFNTSNKFPRQSCLWKIIRILKFPFNLIRLLTIPPPDIDKYNRYVLILLPFTSTLFVLFVTNTMMYVFRTIYIPIIVGIILLIISVIIVKTTCRSRLPNWITILSIFSIILCVTWIWLVAEMLVNLIVSIGVMMGLKPLFLGLTMLPVGNCISDSTLNVILAQAGYQEMSVTGSIAEPLFNTLIGTGIIIIKASFMLEPVAIDFFSTKSIILGICILFLFVNMLSLLFQAIISKFHLGRSVPILGLTLYALFISLISYLSFKN